MPTLKAGTLNYAGVVKRPGPAAVRRDNRLRCGLQVRGPVMLFHALAGVGQGIILSATH
jgi:hypothetical protein